MADLGASLPARRRHEDLPRARRVGSFLVWWVLLMAFWVWIDDSVALAELLVGAGVAVMGALLAEVVQCQAGTHVRIRFEWLAEGLKLPKEVVRDLGVVLGALWSQVVKGEGPRSGFVALPVRPGTDTTEDATRRALITASRSVAPNTLVLGIDRERNVMIVHHLVLSDGEIGELERIERDDSVAGTGTEGT